MSDAKASRQSGSASLRVPPLTSRPSGGLGFDPVAEPAQGAARMVSKVVGILHPEL